jgi:hypothetical protein
VASFTDGDPAARPGHYAVTIDWGDGQTSGGTVRPDGQGGFEVVGSHTYAERGGYVVAVAVADPDGAADDAQGFIDVAGPTEGGLIPAPASAPPARAVSDSTLAELARLLADGRMGAAGTLATEAPSPVTPAGETGANPSASFAPAATPPAYLWARDAEEMTGEIRGTVFEDGAGRCPLAGVIVYLDRNDNGQLDEGERATITDARGEFRFDNLAPGRYTVRVVLPPGQCLTRPKELAYRVELSEGGQVVAGLEFGVTRRAPCATDSPSRADLAAAGEAVLNGGDAASSSPIHQPPSNVRHPPRPGRTTVWWQWLVPAAVVSAGYRLLAGRRVRSGDRRTKVAHPLGAPDRL